MTSHNQWKVTYYMLSTRSHTALCFCYFSSQKSEHILVRILTHSASSLLAVTCWNLHSHLSCTGELSLFKPSALLVIFSKPGQPGNSKQEEEVISSFRAGSSDPASSSQAPPPKGSTLPQHQRLQTQPSTPVSL